VAEIFYATALVALGALGFWRQATVVDPFYQMVTPADRTALAWVEENTPADSRFLVNGFLAYGDSVVVGSDAGWWLPYFTKRANSVPPILYSTERLSPNVDRNSFRQLVYDVRASEGDAVALRDILCRNGLMFVYLGDREGSVGFGETQLIHPEWLQEDRDFTLLFSSARAQVWSFDSSRCEAPGE